MSTHNTLRPFISIGPGYTIKKNLDALGWTQEDLAEMIGLSVKQVSLIITSKARITIETARLLAAVFGNNPEFWVNLDTQYRINLEQNPQKENSAQRKARIRRNMPVPEILKKGWFKSDTSADGYEALYKKIWSTSVDDESVYEQPEEKYCARQNREYEDYTARYTLTWAQVARLKAREVEVSAYSEVELRAISGRLSAYTFRSAGVQEVLRDLKHAGVKVFVLSHLSKTYLDGACFWDVTNPVIVYTARYDRVDNFWFTLAHEIAHVLLHLPTLKDQNFIDDLSVKETNTLEKEADKAAESYLRVQEIIRLATPLVQYLSESRIDLLSRQLEIDPSVIVGVLQYHGLTDYRKLNTYKKKILSEIPDEYVLG